MHDIVVVKQMLPAVVFHSVPQIFFFFFFAHTKGVYSSGIIR